MRRVLIGWFGSHVYSWTNHWGQGNHIVILVHTGAYTNTGVRAGHGDWLLRENHMDYKMSNFSNEALFPEE